MHVARESNDIISSTLSRGHVTADGSEVERSIQLMYHILLTCSAVCNSWTEDTNHSDV